MEVSTKLLVAFQRNDKEEFGRVMEQNYQIREDAYVNKSSERLIKQEKK